MLCRCTNFMILTHGLQSIIDSIKGYFQMPICLLSYGDFFKIDSGGKRHSLETSQQGELFLTSIFSSYQNLPCYRMLLTAGCCGLQQFWLVAVAASWLLVLKLFWLIHCALVYVKRSLRDTINMASKSYLQLIQWSKSWDQITIVDRFVKGTKVSKEWPCLGEFHDNSLGMFCRFGTTAALLYVLWNELRD